MSHSPPPIFDPPDDAAEGFKRPDPERDEALAELQEATGSLSCAAFWSAGVCTSGCYSEPSCQTGRPEGGWVAQARAALDRLEQINTYQP